MDKIPTQALYRIYNKNKELLYIGESQTILHRINNHRLTQFWASEIDFTKTKIEWHTKNKFEMRKLEKIAIEKEKPKYNLTHNEKKEEVRLERERRQKESSEKDNVVKLPREKADEELIWRYFSYEEIVQLMKTNHICAPQLDILIPEWQQATDQRLIKFFKKFKLPELMIWADDLKFLKGQKIYSVEKCIKIGRPSWRLNRVIEEEKRDQERREQIEQQKELDEKQKALLLRELGFSLVMKKRG